MFLSIESNEVRKRENWKGLYLCVVLLVWNRMWQLGLKERQNAFKCVWHEYLSYYYNISSGHSCWFQKLSFSWHTHGRRSWSCWLISRFRFYLAIYVKVAMSAEYSETRKTHETLLYSFKLVLELILEMETTEARIIANSVKVIRLCWTAHLAR